MKVAVAGHVYLAENFENKEDSQLIKFIYKKQLPEDDGSTVSRLITISDGTTTEEVIKILIDRISYLDDLFSCDENKNALNHLSQALDALNKRTEDREKRKVEGKAEI